MLNVRKRVDGIPIFDKLDRPLYHLNITSEKQNLKKCVMVVDEINDIDGRFIELNDCLKEKYEKIDIYTTSPLSSNSYTIEDQYSVKSVLNWINKSVWSNKKKGKSMKIKKSNSKYNGPLKKEIPLIIRLFKSKNENIEMNTIRCNIYTEENVSTYKENKLNKKSNKFTKSNEIYKKQNRKKFSSSKPNLLCIPIKPSKFSWIKKKENKEINSNMSIDDFQFQDSDMSSFLPIKANNIFDQSNRLVEKEYEIERTNLLKRAQLTRENSKKRSIKIEISNEKNESIDEQIFNIQPQQSKKIKTKQNLQSIVIPTNNSIKIHHMNSARNLSASTLVNDQFEGFKCQEPTSYIPSPCCSTSSTLVSPINNSLKAEVDPKFEINSCGYADFLNERLNETVDSEDDEIERKRFSLPATSVNDNKIKGRRRSYAFSLTTNELNLIYSKANQVILSELCSTVENKQKDQYQKERSSNLSKRCESYENGKLFVKGHNRTQSRHRRSHAVCLSSDQIIKFGNDNEDIQQNKRRSRYNRESNGVSLSSYNKLNPNSNKNIPNQDTQLKRRSTSMIKYKNSNSSLSSTASSNGNSYSSNSGNIRPFSNNRLSRDIELLRAIKMKRSRSVPKLDQVETSSSSSRNPAKSRYSMDISAIKDNIGISVHNNSVNSYQQQSNIVYYSFNNKNENINNFSYDGYKSVKRTSSYSLFGDVINQTNISNRWSNVFDNESSCGSSTYYCSEEDGIHNNNNNNNNKNSLDNTKEELINCELDNKTSNSCKKEISVPFIQLLPPTPAINMI